MIQISKPHLEMSEWEALQEPVMSGWLTQGKKVAEFEKEFAEYHQVSAALATTSCTTALHLILAALEVGPGDEVIVPSFTWIATANVVEYCGATPVFVDVDSRSFNIDPAQVKSKLTDKTKAVIVVHLFGLCADIDAIKAQLPSGVYVIEDAACAAGASYKEKFAGGLGDAAAFSFHPRKIITTGEGGMVTTNNPELAEKMQKMRNHGAEISEEQRHHGSQPYLLPDFNLLGFNYRMTDLQGAIGVTQMRKLTMLIEQRKQMAQQYYEQLADIQWLNLPVIKEGYHTSWQAFVTSVNGAPGGKSRNEIMAELNRKGISTRPGTHAVHLQNFYADKYQFTPESFPNSYWCHHNTMALPLHNCMSAEDLNAVCLAIKQV